MSLLLGDLKAGREKGAYKRHFKIRSEFCFIEKCLPKFLITVHLNSPYILANDLTEHCISNIEKGNEYQNSLSHARDK